MQNPIRSLVVSTLALGLLALAACAETPPSRFYLLSYAPDAAAPANATTAREGVAIGVGPVTLPRYLERQDVTTRSSANQLELAGFDRWGGELDDDVIRVLAENLSALLQTDRVSAYPYDPSAPVDYQITVKVSAFETDESGNSRLDVRWNVLGDGGTRYHVMAKSSFQQPTGQGGESDEDGDPGVRYEAIAEAMSRNLWELSEDIAERLRTLPQP